MSLPAPSSLGPSLPAAPRGKSTVTSYLLQLLRNVGSNVLKIQPEAKKLSNRVQPLFQLYEGILQKQ